MRTMTVKERRQKLEGLDDYKEVYLNIWTEGHDWLYRGSLYKVKEEKLHFVLTAETNG